MINSRLIKISSLTFVSTLVKMLTSFFTNKIVALFVGPNGLAIIGQFGNFIGIFSSISTGGVTAGTTKFVSEYKTQPEKCKPYIIFTLQLSVLISVISGIIIIFLSNFASNHIFGNAKYSTIITIFGITLLFYSLNSALLSIINGFGYYKNYVIINIINSIVGFTFTIVLVILWKLEGALLAMVTYQSVIFLITFFFIRNLQYFTWNEFFQKINRSVRNDLFQYTLMTLLGTILYPIAQIIIRNYLILNVSLADAGIWEGLNRISNIYIIFITSTLSVYYLPRLSELQSNYEIMNEVLNTLKIITPFLLISIFLVVSLRDNVILLLFSKEFISMRGLFIVQFIALFVKVIGWLIAYPMLAKKMTKKFISTEILYNICWVLISIPLINHYGIQGAVVGYLITYIIYLIYVVIIMKPYLFITHHGAN